MKAVAFESELRSDGTLAVPANVADQIPLGQGVQVVVLVAEDAADKAWEQLAAEDFGMGYADSDAIYDQLSSR
jgi:hypothetical protein